MSLLDDKRKLARAGRTFAHVRMAERYLGRCRQLRQSKPVNKGVVALLMHSTLKLSNLCLAAAPTSANKSASPDQRHMHHVHYYA